MKRHIARILRKIAAKLDGESTNITVNNVTVTNRSGLTDDEIARIRSGLAAAQHITNVTNKAR